MRFNLLDRITELESGRRLAARKTFAGSEELFEDHFPGMPRVPGTLQIEAMAQAGGWLLFDLWERSLMPVLTLVDSAKFRHFVGPGVELEIVAELNAVRGPFARVDASIHARLEPSSDGAPEASRERVAQARLAFHALDPAGDEAVGRVVDWALESFRTLDRRGD